MLTRLRVQNFKNLRDVEVHFGPLTVIAGPNGIGKSNLLDAIQFLSNTASMTLTQAAAKIRGTDASNSDIRKLFFATDGEPANICLEADLILPSSAQDNLGQVAIPSARFVTYSIEIALLPDLTSTSPISLVREKVSSRDLEELPESFRDLDTSLQQVPVADFIRSPEAGEFELLVERQSLWSKIFANYNGNSSTVVSRVNAGGYPTVASVQLELRSWSSFQFNPLSLMAPSAAAGDATLARDGSRLAAAIYRLARQVDPNLKASKDDESNPIYRRILYQVQTLIPELAALWVMMDDSKTTLYLRVQDKWGNTFFASSLSEGTLRLIALATLAEDESLRSLIAMEEPENGFHPRQMHHVLSLLRSIPDIPSQVIVSTHSPALVACSPEDAILFASSEPKAGVDETCNTLRLSCLSGTWRAALPGQHVASKSELFSFLGVVPNPARLSEDQLEHLRGNQGRAVFERPEFLEHKLQSAL